MLLDPDTIHETLPFYLKAEMGEIVPDSWKMSFGKYDFFPVDSTGLFFDFSDLSVLSMQLAAPGSIGAAIPFSTLINSVLFLLFLFSFMFFAFIFRWEAVALKGDFKSLLSFGTNSVTVRKSQVTKTEAWGEFYLLFQAILIFTILIFYWLWINKISTFSFEELTFVFIGIFFGIALLIYLKILGYKLIGSFFLKYDMRNWAAYYARVMEILGLVFFLPVVFYIYLHEIRIIILIALVVLFFTSRIVIYIELLNIFVKNKINAFYFFVYLCGTEIAPYLLLYKMVLFAITIAGDNII